MKSKTLLVALSVLALVTLACGLQVNLPVDKIKTGPEKMETINVPAPQGAPAKLSLNFGAGELNLTGGGTDLVNGTATYNVADFKPEVETAGNEVTISTGDLEINGIPKLSKRDIVNEWDFQLGSTPMNLVIGAGAYKGQIELGGLSLRSLEVNDGAADVKMSFSQPNLEEMESFRYTTGASTLKLFGLSNANFQTMIFRSGAGDYTLDFNGVLERDASILIESGLSQVTIIIPEGMSASLIFKGGLANVEANGAWEKSGNRYLNPGNGPVLTFTVDMGAGNLILQNQP